LGYFGQLSEGACCLSQRSGLRMGFSRRETSGPKYPPTGQSAEGGMKMKTLEPSIS